MIVFFDDGVNERRSKKVKRRRCNLGIFTVPLSVPLSVMSFCLPVCFLRLFPPLPCFVCPFDWTICPFCCHMSAILLSSLCLCLFVCWSVYFFCRRCWASTSVGHPILSIFFFSLFSLFLSSFPFSLFRSVLSFPFCFIVFSISLSFLFSFSFFLSFCSVVCSVFCFFCCFFTP